MKTKLFAILLLAGSSLFARSHFSIGIGIGGYGYYPPAPVYVYSPPPTYVYAPPVRYVAPPYPGPDYAWIDGYYYPAGPRWVYRSGYWARRPYPRAYWVAPRYYRSHWYRGYWR
jgi:hypothetical protein